MIQRCGSALLGTLALGTLGMVACTSSEPSDPAYVEATELHAGCSGGIRGMVEIVIVSRDGSVRYKQSGGPADAASGRVDRVDPARVSEWLQRLEAADFLELDTREFDTEWRRSVRDGIACGLTLIGPTRSNGVRVESAAGIPESVRAVYDEIHALAEPSAQR